MQNRKNRGFEDFLLTKPGVCAYNVYNRIEKDFDGKFAITESCREPAVGASRCGKFWRSDSRVGLVNAYVSNEIRFPPLQG